MFPALTSDSAVSIQGRATAVKASPAASVEKQSSIADFRAFLSLSETEGGDVPGTETGSSEASGNGVRPAIPLTNSGRIPINGVKILTDTLLASAMASAGLITELGKAAAYRPVADSELIPTAVAEVSPVAAQPETKTAAADEQNPPTGESSTDPARLIALIVPTEAEASVPAPVVPGTFGIEQVGETAVAADGLPGTSETSPDSKAAGQALRTPAAGSEIRRASSGAGANAGSETRSVDGSVHGGPGTAAAPGTQPGGQPVMVLGTEAVAPAPAFRYSSEGPDRKVSGGKTDSQTRRVLRPLTGMDTGKAEVRGAAEANGRAEVRGGAAEAGALVPGRMTWAGGQTQQPRAEPSTAVPAPGAAPGAAGGLPVLPEAIGLGRINAQEWVTASVRTGNNAAQPPSLTGGLEVQQWAAVAATAAEAVGVVSRPKPELGSQSTGAALQTTEAALPSTGAVPQFAGAADNTGQRAVPAETSLWAGAGGQSVAGLAEPDVRPPVEAISEASAAQSSAPGEAGKEHAAAAPTDKQPVTPRGAAVEVSGTGITARTPAPAIAGEAETPASARQQTPNQPQADESAQVSSRASRGEAPVAVGGVIRTAKQRSGNESGFIPAAGQAGSGVLTQKPDTARSTASAAPAAEATTVRPEVPQGSTPAQVLNVRLDGPEGVDVRFVHRNGETQMSVRSENTEIAQRLRTDLPELTQHLSDKGFRFEQDARERHPQRAFTDPEQQPEQHRRPKYQPEEEEQGPQDD